MYRIGICANMEEAKKLEEACRKYGERQNLALDSETWFSADALTEEIRRGREFEVLFVEITDAEDSAIGLGKCLREEQRNFKTQLIYLANRECYSRALIQTMPFDFLLTGNSMEAVEDILDRVFLTLRRAAEKFEFKFGKNYFSIPTEDIVYVCSDLRRVRVKTKEEEFEFNGLLRDVIAGMPKDFIVIHKSFIINKTHVISYAYETVKLSDGTILSISKTNRSRVKKCMMAGRRTA